MSHVTDEVDELRDALDHIMRVARASRTQTRRLRWIEARARCVLEGGTDWKDIKLPPSGESIARRNMVLRAKLKSLKGELGNDQDKQAGDPKAPVNHGRGRK